LSAPRSVARAIDALRHGWAVRVAGVDGSLLLLPVETAEETELTARSDVLISGHRAATLKLANQRDAVPDSAVRVAFAPWLRARILADPAHDLAAPLQGPFAAAPLIERAAGNAAVRLARLAGLLPAFYIVHEAEDPSPVSAEDVMAFDAGASVRLVTRARLPLAATRSAEIVAFRSDGNDPVALVIGSPSGRPPLVRLHSECLTGDALGSAKCDCGPQLDASLARIAADGWGMLLYLRQEGRGVGLVNKLRAYALQDQGFDTVDANLRLGFEDDARDFAIAAAMLRLLGQDSVRLLTNNPRKLAGLKSAGVAVAERLPLRIGEGADNLAYLRTKRDRSGHLL
jgi:GTP cyclohydrolase II